MRYYELLYIVNPNLEDDIVKNIIDEIGNEVNKYKVSIINHYLWGKKRLAYPINKNKYGIYLLLQFSAEQFDFLKNFKRYLILNKLVIRHQLVRLDEMPAKVENIEPITDNNDSFKDESSEIPNDDNIVEIEDSEDAKKTEKVDVEESESEQEIKEEDK